MQTKLHELGKLGQSIWYDNISRKIIENGELQKLLNQGVMGITSNPTIFEKAIAGSADYDMAIQEMVAADKSVDQIYETLAVTDIRQAATMLRPIYERTQGKDGYISLEVSPALAHDTQGAIREARHYWQMLGQPNVMIKIPATPAGIPAIAQLISEGININVTLIFSLDNHEAVMEAYMSGLEKRAAAGGSINMIASVASFFVSRVDSAIDPQLAKLGATELQGQAAIANAKLAYARFQEIFSGPRWEKLAALGANVQRPLWASTGVKNPAYPDTLYADALIGAETVNTVPPATLTAILDHGTLAETLTVDVAGAKRLLSQLSKTGIDMAQVTQQLQDDGVASFAKSFETLMAALSSKRDQLQANMKMKMAA